MSKSESFRACFRDPIPEIAVAARLLDEAIKAHIEGDGIEAEGLIRSADMPVIREWLESVWGAGSPHVRYRAVPDASPALTKDQRVKVRMPSSEEKRFLLQRDGYHCRFCSMPVIRSEIRVRIAKAYPSALPWGNRNSEQHAAFQAMWLQYDHIVPHARGGTNGPDNMVITCAACNFGRMNYLLEEVGLLDPRLRDPFRSAWDGLEQFAAAKSQLKATDGVGQGIKKTDLRLADVPEPTAGPEVIEAFALTFDGYEECGSFERCAAIANARCHGTLFELRSCLFFEQRRWHHLGEAPDAKADAYHRELISMIREKVALGQK
ncbi:MAG: HNH endonuclease [Thermomonas sp.]